MMTLLAQSPSPSPGSTQSPGSVINEPSPGPLTDLVDKTFGSDVLTFLTQRILDPLIEALIILFIAWVVLWFVRRMIRRAVEDTKDDEKHARLMRLRRRARLAEGPSRFSLRRAQRADALGALFSSVAAFIIWTMAALAALGSFGVELGPFIAGAGILGVALGFGAQNLVRDFLSGVFMMLEDQYGVGDVIDVGEASGVVEGVSLRTTRIRDVTGALWHVPNGVIQRVGNSSQDWARALLDVGIAYGADVDHAAEVIMGVAREMAEEETYREIFLAEPEILGVQNLGPDSVDIRLVVKTKPGEQWAIARELRRRIKMAFDHAHIEIPFSQRTVWLRSIPEEEPVAEEPPPDPSAPSAAHGKGAAEEGARETSDRQTETPSPHEPESERGG